MHLRLMLDHGLAVAEIQRIDDACDRFESAWRGGDQPELESFLASFVGPARTQLLRDLLGLELDLRLEQGDVPDCHAYRQRFPGTMTSSTRFSVPGERPMILILNSDCRKPKSRRPKVGQTTS